MTHAKEKTLDTPIFVVGPLRSGTTLLRLLLGKHPDINMFGEFEGAVCQANNDAWPALNEYYDFVENDRQMQAHKFDVDASLDYINLIQSFLKQAHDRSPKKWVGASIHSRIDLLPNIWPDAKFIHILRDPRDVAKSCIGMGWVGNVYTGATYWLKPEQHWDTLLTKTPKENTLSVCYETLVNSPEQTLSDICCFLDLDYDPEMLEIDKSSTYGKPSGKFANQWKTKLSAKEINWVEAECFDLMKQRGYPTEATTKPTVNALTKARLRLQSRIYRATRSIKTLGILTWLTHKTLQITGPKSLYSKINKHVNQTYSNRLR